MKFDSAISEDKDLSEKEILDVLLRRSELVGSRGRAKHYNKPPPKDSDYDYAVFTDEPEEFGKLKQMFIELAKKYHYKLRRRFDGYTVSRDKIDISLYPSDKKNEIVEAWKLQEQGLSKEDSWNKINRRNQQIY